VSTRDGLSQTGGTWRSEILHFQFCGSMCQHTLETISGRVQGGGQGYAKMTREEVTSRHLCPADSQWGDLNSHGKRFVRFVRRQ
jgi:hypothetical protein